MSPQIMKNIFIDHLLKRGLIKAEDNVYYAEKAFKLNSIMRWCINEPDPQQLSRYLLLIERFLAGTIDIQLKDDKLVVSTITNKRKNV